MAHAYAAFTRAVAWAVAHGAGFALATYWPGAEDELADKRRRDQERLAAAAVAPRRSPEEESALLRELQAKIDRMAEEGRGLALEADLAHERQVIAATRRELYLVPHEHLAEIRALARVVRSGAGARMARLRARAAECALERVAFSEPDERHALEHLLHVAMGRSHLPRRGGALVLSAPEVAAMAREFTAWRRGQRGRANAVDGLTIHVGPGTHEACDRAFQHVAELFARVRRRKRHADAALVALLLSTE